MRMVLVSLLCLALVGCATVQQFSKVSTGMSKEQVRKSIGLPDAVKGRIINKYAQLVEVWEYSRYEGETWTDTMFQTPKDYWFYFVNHKLVQWGPAGDWQQEAERIPLTKFQF